MIWFLFLCDVIWLSKWILPGCYLLKKKKNLIISLHGLHGILSEEQQEAGLAATPCGSWVTIDEDKSGG